MHINAGSNALSEKYGSTGTFLVSKGEVWGRSSCNVE